ncbi:MAG: hypothetical protein HY870_23315 [Chloroflexi bacterium]|nr:hypothetical protein [Chloroflexota bacterium]
MPPDIEWRVGAEDEQETVTRTSAAAPSRWRRLLLALTMISGAGLGLLYTALPEPQPSVPTPQPTTLPLPPLEPIINRESHALASGDKSTFMALQDQVDGAWYRERQAAFKLWGTPPGDRLYTILEQGYSATGRAWAEITQWVSPDVYVRETRFYQLRETIDGPQWKRARPDRSFWSGAQWRGSSVQFQIAYPAEDNRQAWRVTERFERVYDVLCRDLNCPAHTRRTQAINLIFDPAQAAPVIDAGNGLTITLPSPRLLEFHEPYGAADDAVTALAYRVLLDPVTRQASGDAARWYTTTGGDLILQGIQAWQQLRIQLARATPPEQIFINAPGELWPGPSQGEPDETQQFYRDLLTGAQIMPLAQLWALPPDILMTSGDGDVIDAELDALIAFIEERYGNAGVIQFLNALGPARSIDQAIEAAFSVPFADFNQQWLEWIDQ